MMETYDRRLQTDAVCFGHGLDFFEIGQPKFNYNNYAWVYDPSKLVELEQRVKITVIPCTDGTFKGRAVGLLGPEGWLTTDIPTGQYSLRAWWIGSFPGGGMGTQSIAVILDVDHSTPLDITLTRINGNTGTLHAAIKRQ